MYDAISIYDAVYSDSILIDDNNEKLNVNLSDLRPLQDIYDSLGFAFLNVASGHTMLATRKVIDESMPIPVGHHHDWWIAVQASNGNGLKYFNEKLTLYRQHDKNLSENIIVKKKGNRSSEKRYCQYLKDISRLETLKNNRFEKNKKFYTRLHDLYILKGEGRFSSKLFFFLLKHQRRVFRFSRKNFLSQIFEIRKFLMKLIVGLYRPQEGKVEYNKKDETTINFDELRKQIGFVTQDTNLFSGTIKENLLFVNPVATEADLADVLSKASCNNLIARAEKGIDTMIGEGGLKLSGGEKQRLSIARALLRKPNILIFDEATSALDSLTEEEITNTIKEVSSAKEQITILIAQRLSTIMHADRIYVLEKGDIVETGTHEELLAEKGLYYAMWRQQIGERKKFQGQPA